MHIYVYNNVYTIYTRQSMICKTKLLEKMEIKSQKANHSRFKRGGGNDIKIHY